MQAEQKQRGKVLFKPGQSGNPNGRVKGKSSIKAAIERVITKEDADAIAEKLIKNAKLGHIKALTLLMAYTDGKPVQHSQKTTINILQMLSEAQNLPDPLDNAIQIDADSHKESVPIIEEETDE